ncbi:14153_t:CDS:2 [Acaulospora colombiana]|uniref:14153_t:CDS:1 n=1 Tax=Acaulospora colombiana TaxID=27376 RepID=A0ACA9M5Q4_9GLOM|nr:14153_t:CDS:2 [Acaulospora colombiana]
MISEVSGSTSLWTNTSISASIFVLPMCLSALVRSSVLVKRSYKYWLHAAFLFSDSSCASANSLVIDSSSLTYPPSDSFASSRLSNFIEELNPETTRPFSLFVFVFFPVADANPSASLTRRPSSSIPELVSGKSREKKLRTLSIN